MLRCSCGTRQSWLPCCHSSYLPKRGQGRSPPLQHSALMLQGSSDEFLPPLWRHRDLVLMARRMQIIEADVYDPAALEDTMRVHGACICTAGNAHSPTTFEGIFKGRRWSKLLLARQLERPLMTFALTRPLKLSTKPGLTLFSDCSRCGCCGW